MKKTRGSLLASLLQRQLPARPAPADRPDVPARPTAFSSMRFTPPPPTISRSLRLIDNLGLGSELDES